jgi:hypothetical protein
VLALHYAFCVQMIHSEWCLAVLALPYPVRMIWTAGMLAPPKQPVKPVSVAQSLAEWSGAGRLVQCALCEGVWSTCVLGCWLLFHLASVASVSVVERRWQTPGGCSLQRTRLCLVGVSSAHEHLETAGWHHLPTTACCGLACCLNGLQGLLHATSLHSCKHAPKCY